MARKIANTESDPTLAKTGIEIEGKTYNLCFDLGALAEAEAQFIREGHDVNLLRALPELNLSNVRIVFPCAIHKFHPDLSFKKAQALITLQNVYTVAAAVAGAWQSAVPEAPKEKVEAENPPQP
jgi:hypothetical protein